MRRSAKLLALLAASLASQANAQNPVDANNAATIGESSPASSDAAKAESPPAAATGDAQPFAPLAPVLIVPPASESRMLGKPAAAASRSTPNTDSKAAAAGGRDSDSTGWLGALDPSRNEFTRVLGALAAVVGLILLARTLAVRYLPSAMGGKGDRPSGVIEVLARYPIGRGQQLLVLKFARRILLVHQAGTAARTLTEMTDPDEVAATLSRLEAGASAGGATRFRDALNSFEREHEAVIAQRSRIGAALAATETEIIDLTRTRILDRGGIGGISGARRVLR